MMTRTLTCKNFRAQDGQVRGRLPRQAGGPPASLSSLPLVGVCKSDHNAARNIFRHTTVGANGKTKRVKGEANPQPVV